MIQNIKSLQCKALDNFDRFERIVTQSNFDADKMGIKADAISSELSHREMTKKWLSQKHPIRSLHRKHSSPDRKGYDYT